MAEPIADLKDRLKVALNLNNMKPIELSELTKIPKSAISQYMSGYAKPKQDRIYLISKALNISEAWLMGFDVPMEKNSSRTSDNTTLSFGLDTLPRMRKIPLIGNIACGIPILAEENIEEYVDLPESIHADFSLRCKGDSMINARIFDGDIVYIRKQPTVENGQIAAVLVEGIECEATLKKVYLNQDSIRLCAANPTFKDLVYYQEEMNRVRIIGRAVAFTSTIK